MNSAPGQTEPATPNLPGEVRARSWPRRFPIACFLAALLLTLVCAPFYDLFRDGDLVEAVLLTVMLLSSLPALGVRRKSLIAGIVLIVPAATGRWLNHAWPYSVSPEVFLLPGLLFLLFFVGHLLRFTLRAPRIDSEVLCAGLAGYLMLGLLWSFAYILVARLIPDSFVFNAGPAGQSMKGFTAIYFSFVTLCTVGYGEIVPLSGPVRMLAIMEAICGTFYMTVLIARLVAMYSVAPSEIPTPKSNS